MKASSIFFLAVVPVVAFASAQVGCGDDSATGAGGETSGGTSTHATGTGSTTGASPTTATTTTTTTTSSTGTGMLMCPDGSYSNITPSADCDLFLQNCPNMAKCVVTDDGNGGSTTSCQGTVGLKTVGQDCATNSECAEGLLCFDVCTAICCPTNMQPCNGGQCNLTINFQDQQGNPTGDHVMVCTFSPQCTLFDPSTCDTGYDCHPDTQPGLATCIQPSGANVPEGGVCEAVNDCGTMQACVGNDPDPYHCRYLCTPGSTAAPELGGCPAAQTCQPTDIFGFPNVGLCTPN